MQKHYQELIGGVGNNRMACKFELHENLIRIANGVEGVQKPVPDKGERLPAK